MFALVDCNNFYVSCERAFNPSLEQKPVVVLSNNDGCIISRSNEAKKLGITMGAPFFKWKKFCEENQVHVFSSNYELYGDMSKRVMQVLKYHCPQVEIYSIDEAFLGLDDITMPNITKQMLHIKKIVKKWTGIPVSIGVSETKTLAKIANYIAKNNTTEQIYYIEKHNKEKILTDITIDRVWGIGSQLAKKLQTLNIFTAKHLYDADPKMIRLHSSVILERIVQELRGVACIPLDKNPVARKQIICSRSFGKSVSLLEELEEAISYYTAIAGTKLRQQHHLASAIYVFVETNRFNKTHTYYGDCVGIPFSVPTMDTRLMIQVAKKCIRHLYKKNLKYHKAGVILLDLIPNIIQQYDFLANQVAKSELLMQSMDLINEKHGRNTIYFCAEGINKNWKMQAKKPSSRFTTRWNELVQVF